MQTLKTRPMAMLLSVAMLCTPMLNGCGGSGGGHGTPRTTGTPDPGITTPLGAALPTPVLEQPPRNGELPRSLRPPIL